MFSTIVDVKIGFRAVHLRDGAVVAVYGPGRHSVFSWSGLNEIRQIDLSSDLSPLAMNDPLPEDLEGTTLIQIEPHERAATFARGLMRQVLVPGRYRWWNALGDVRIMRFDLREPPVALGADDPLPPTHSLYSVVTLTDPGLLSKEGRAVGTVPPGRYRIWSSSPWSVAALPRAMTAVKEVLSEPPPRGMSLHAVGVHERAVVFWNGVLLHVLNPGRYQWWDVLGPVDVLRFDIREEPAPLASDDPLPSGSRADAWDEGASVEGNALVLVRDGQPYRALPPGRYRTWKGGRWSLKSVPLSLQLLDIAAQDLLSADQVPLRLKPSAVVRVVDPVMVLRQPDWSNQIYLAVQLALREVVTGRTLEALLADREVVGGELLERARARLPEVGLSLESASVKDIILPGEVKDLLNRVTLARKEAEALAIKRREETAQTRQLANTARLLESNPVLLRLKELEALGEIAGKIDRITLVGSGDMVKSVLLSDLARDKGAAAGEGD